MEPYEVIAAPYEIYLAEAGTDCPDIDDETLTDWTLLGSNDRFGDDGVLVELEQEIGKFTPGGTTQAIKAFRSTEGRKVSFSIADLSPDAKAQAVDGTVDVTAAGVGVPGKKSVVLLRGVSVATYALLARGLSAEDEDFIGQLYEPKVFQSANVSAALKKGADPAMVAFTFESLYDDANDPVWEDQTAAPTE
jgi:hypothetical protein